MPAETRPTKDAAKHAAHLAAGSEVHVVDDDDAVRCAFGLLLRAAGLKVRLHDSAEAFLESAANGTETIACVLTDLRMPGLDGLGLLRRLRRMGFARPVILVTARGDVPIAVQAMREGAADFIEKPCDEAQLLEAIVAALIRHMSVAPVASEDGSGDLARSRIAALSPRERQVLHLLANGRPNKEVARILGLSSRTVEIHRARMMARLGVRSFAEAVRVAVQAESSGLAGADAAESPGEAPPADDG